MTKHGAYCHQIISRVSQLGCLLPKHIKQRCPVTDYPSLYRKTEGLVIPSHALKKNPFLGPSIQSPRALLNRRLCPNQGGPIKERGGSFLLCPSLNSIFRRRSNFLGYTPGSLERELSSPGINLGLLRGVLDDIERSIKEACAHTLPTSTASAGSMIPPSFRAALIGSPLVECHQPTVKPPSCTRQFGKQLAVKCPGYIY